MQDTGCGIEETQLATLFEPFTQVDPSSRNRVSGVGLGLSISKALAEHLGGDLQVISTPGTGSVFIATVATGPVPTADLAWDVQAFTQASQVRPLRVARAPALRGKILVADDNPANQNLISLYLRRCGLLIEIAANGQEAVEKAQQDVFDLILMDMRMPVMGGLDATELLRLTGFDRPIIALSANIERSDIETALAAGCDAYLPKPIHLDAFYKMLAHYLPSGQQAQEMPVRADRHADDDPELARLRTEFLTELPGRMALMRAAHEVGDWESLRSQAHQIKGVGSNFGMPELTRLAGAMEFQILRGDFNEVADLIDEMEHLWR